MTQKYTWKQGDDLFAVAKKYGTTSTAILEANPGLRQPIAGIVLTIPGVTTTSGGDPKGPWTPDLPTPDPKDPYAVTPTPKPVLPEWFPKKRKTTPGVPDPKGPWTPDLPTPAPGATQPIVQPRLEPSRPGLPTLPPLDPSRVGQVPQAKQVTDLLPETQKSLFATPAGAYVRAATAVDTRIQGYLDQLYVKWAPAARRLMYQGVRNLETTPALYTPPGFEGQRQPGSFNLPALGLKALARGVGVTGPGKGQPAGWQGMPPEDAAQARAAALANVPFTGLYQQRYGIPTTTGESQGYILGDFRDAQGNLIVLDEGTKANIERKANIEMQKARNKAQLLYQGIRPMFISDKERELMGLTAQEMTGQGYVFDKENQQWIHTGETEGPQVAGAAGAAGQYGGSRGGYAGGYAGYPRGGGGGGGYGYPVYGAGVGGVEINFPEGTRSFVSRGQRGVSPQALRNQAARFGAVAWRIG